MLVRSIFRFRYLALVVAAILLVHSLGFVVLGVVRGIETYQLMAQGPAAWTGADRPGIRIAESVDALLFSLALMVLAIGTASLFLGRPQHGAGLGIPRWLQIENLSDLKLLLWEAVLVVMVVAAMASILADLENLNWKHLVLPGAVFLLSAGLFFARRPGGSRPEG